MASRQVTPLDVDRVLRGANINVQAGALRADNREFSVESGPFVQTTREAETLVVGVYSGRPVYLRDVAAVTDGPEEPTTYTRISFGPGSKVEYPAEAGTGADFPAVTLGIAKRKGSNAVAVARALEAKVDELRRDVIPHDIEIRVTRNNGETADRWAANTRAASAWLIPPRTAATTRVRRSWRASGESVRASCGSIPIITRGAIEATSASPSKPSFSGSSAVRCRSQAARGNRYAHCGEVVINFLVETGRHV
jgi:hypothetical protein